MPTLFANPHLSMSAGNLNSCSRPSVLKVAVVAAAAELLCLAGESVDGVMLLNGNDKETLTAICKFKDDSSRARSSVAVKAVLVTGLFDLKWHVKTQECHWKRPLGSPLPPCRGCGLIGRCERTSR
jgi:hypothetical protein